MNRRSFFRFFGRATGTAVAVVVGGAALLPALKATEIKWMGSLELPRNVMDPLNELEQLRADSAEWKAFQRKLLAVAKQKSPIF